MIFEGLCIKKIYIFIKVFFKIAFMLKPRSASMKYKLS